MVVGSMDSGVIIDHCYAALNLTVNPPHGTYFGGIAGQSNGKIQNSVVTGRLSISTSSTVSDDKIDYICGGIIGRMGDGNIESCEFIGTIDIPSGFEVARQSHFGGIAGTIGAINDSHISKQIEITDTVTVKNTKASGKITVTASGAGKTMIGGISGASNGTSSNAVVFENCEYYNGGIDFTRTGAGGFTNIGGFVADAVANTEFINCESDTVIKVNNTTTTLIPMNIGGFLGALKGGVSRCYSATSIEVNINSAGGDPGWDNLYIGGFGGLIEGPSTISRCYATGSITIISIGGEKTHHYVGGFVGTGKNTVSFEDCYATGNIMLDRAAQPESPFGSTDVSGFSGSLTGSKIIRCFSTGSFSIKSIDGNGSVGGLIGYLFSGNEIENSVVLGSYITGLNSYAMGKISANYVSSAYTDNYAIDTFKLYVISGTTVTEFVDIPSGGGGYNPVAHHPDRHGTSIKRVQLTASFWRGLGYDDSVWDLGTPVTRNGWPTLKNVGGQQ